MKLPLSPPKALLLGSLGILPLCGSNSPNLTSLATPNQTTSHGSGLYPALHVLDDDLTTFNHTDSSGVGAALELTFPSEQEIGSIDLITRNCCGGRLNGATLRLFDASNTQVFEIDIVDSGPLSLFTATIPANTFAQQVRIGFEPGQSGIVHLAEVDVFGPPADPPEITSFAPNPAAITSGQSSTLSWSTNFATAVDLRGFGAVGTDVSYFVNPTESTAYFLTASNDCGSVTRSAGVEVDGVPLLPRITEFSAYPDDWIEIWNPSPTPLVLTDWTLTDDSNDDNKWTFPSGTSIQPGEILVINEPFGLAREAGS